MSHPPRKALDRALALAVLALLILPAGAASAATAPAPPSRTTFYVEPGLQYVVIAPSGLARYLGPLVDWKLDRGVPAELFTLETILATYSGRDDAEKVHNFLKDLYFNITKGTPKWLLIGGDSDQMPVRYLWADRDHTNRKKVAQNLYLGDMYFGGLDSDWDANRNKVWGEPGEEDATPELYVGRIAASNPAEMDAAVTKTLRYELDPPNGDWFTKAFVAGALMDEPNLRADPYVLPSDDFWADTGFNPFVDNAWEISQKVKAILDGGWDTVALADYPFFAGGNYSLEVDTLDHQSAVAAWSRGNDLVFWASHGYEAFGGLADYQGDGVEPMSAAAEPFITSEDVTDPSTGGMLPLVYVSSCYVGQFDKADNKSFEGMLTVPDGGAIGLIAADGETFRMENISAESFGNWWLSQRFFELLVKGGMNRPGQTLAELKRQYYDFYKSEGPSASDRTDMDYFYVNYYAYNLLGDPEVPVWLGPPGRLALEVVRGAVANSTNVVVRVTDKRTGAPVAGATVHCRGAGVPGLLSATTGPDGTATVSPGPSELGGTLRLAATMNGMVSARSQVQVGLGVHDLSVSASDIAGPRYLEHAGDTITFNVTVHDAGDFSASSVPLRFDSGDAGAPAGEGTDARYQTKLVDIAPAGTVTVEFSHRYASPGTYTVEVRVDPGSTYPDVNVGNNAASVQLAYRPSPTVPEQIGPFSVAAGRVHDEPIDLDAYVTLPNGVPRDISFEVVDATVGLGVWMDAGNELHLLPGPDMAGSATVTVRLLVDGGPAGDMSVLLDVTPTNMPPMVSAPAHVSGTAGEPVTFLINATDPDGDPVTLATDLQGATIEGRMLRWVPGAADAGSHIARITATDPQGATATAHVEIVVTATNIAPEFRAGAPSSAKVQRDKVAYLAFYAQDPDRDTITYGLAASDPGFSIDRLTGLVTFDAKGHSPGHFSAVVVASDGSASVERTVTVEVQGRSGVPVLALIVAGVVLLVAVGSLVLFKPR